MSEGGPRPFDLLQRYLDTTGEPPAFVLARSAQIDGLLGRWAFLGQDVAPELRSVLAAQAGRRTGGPTGERWSRIAASVHGHASPVQRLNTYLEGLWKLSRLPPPAGEDDTVQLHPAHRRCPHLDTAGRLTALVRSWGATQPCSSRLHLALDGPMLSDMTVTYQRRVRGRAAFNERLEQELSRSRRHDLRLSVLLVRPLDLLEAQRRTMVRGHAREAEVLRQLTGVLGESLRTYDVLCRNDEGELMAILPGAAASDCAAVVARLRGRLPVELRVAAGAAAFPDQACWPRELLAAAEHALAGDIRRQIEGRVELEGIPAGMVEQLGTGEQEPAVWFQGLPTRMPVQVLRTSDGVRLKLPLSFLRKGRAFRLDSGQAVAIEGVVREAMVSRYRAADESPVVFLDIRRA